MEHQPDPRPQDMGRRGALRLLGAGAAAVAAGPVLGNLLWPANAHAADRGAAGLPGYHLDTAATELRPDTALPGFGGVGGGVTYGVTYNGWTRNGQAWYPLSGEFHYVRYAADRWERELGKMRAAGLDTVATYAFWNHHENPEGTWDWTGRRDIRAFVAAARRQGLLVWLRVGPYINSETDNGGIPSFALSNERTDDPGYLAKVGSYFSQLADQLRGQFVKDGGPIVGIQLENEFASGSAPHITTLRRMCEERGMVVPYYTVTANSRFEKNIAIPLQGSYIYRGWETSGGTSAVSGFIYGSDEWTANTDIGGSFYQTLDYPRGFCELGTGSPMHGNDRFLVEPRYTVANTYDCVGRGSNNLGYYMFHGGTQVPGMSTSWPLTYDFQAPLGEFGQTRQTYRYYRRLHTFTATYADELVRARVSRDPQQIMNPTQTGRLRYIGRFDGAGRGFVFVNNTQRGVTLPARNDMQINVHTAGATITLPQQPLTMPVDRSNVFPLMTNLNGVDLRWATVEPLAKIAGDDIPTFVYWAPDWTDRALAFDPSVVLTGESGTFTQAVTGAERIANVPAGQRTSLLVRKSATQNASARIIVLTEAESLNAAVAPLNGRDRLIITEGAQLSALAPTVRFAGRAGNTITTDVFPAGSLTPAAGWSRTQAASTPFARYTFQLAAAPAAPQVTSATGNRWRITSTPTDLADLAEAHLVLDYRGGDAKLIGAGTTITNDLYHGEAWTIDLKSLTDAARADLLVEVSAWNTAIHGVPRPADPTPALTGWTWNPMREAAWNGPVVTVPTGYHAVTVTGTGDVIDVSGSSTANVATIIRYPNHNGANQRFEFRPLGDGYVRIVNQNSGKDLVVLNASQAAGAKIIQYAYVLGPTTNDEWRLEDAGNGNVRIANRYSNLYLTAGTAQGAQFEQRPYDAGSPQTFTVT
ncbi:beta-galactosidase [Kitasatospora sp. NBC_00240]|uniref:beta-galactosidase n=1 Tax=Kitasatospora sp. NBC_00240 TaxID=2903567 RepID=UPI00225A08D7|nr:beta-galactosidase [Kitasatospora sp. NBC_00240]MCX5208323.1 beta-galactosidase [Kitasatospora sp. NBC_00240]